MTPPLRLLLLVLASVFALPVTANACPVCFGAVDSPLLDAAKLGVLAMVGFTVGILALFAAWFLRLRRLAALHAIAEERPGGSRS